MSIDTLIEELSRERGEATPQNLSAQQKEEFFRGLCNLRSPKPIGEEFLLLQDRYLQQKTGQRGVVDVATLKYQDGISLWQGDISRLNSDAIVNACNGALLGCFQPLHNCIDNVIHSNAGVQVRRDCQEIMEGRHLPNGEVMVTPAYNLPSQSIFHTVGPIIQNSKPNEQQADELTRCYLSCLEKAQQMKLSTLSFCCISSGVYGYPQRLAAELAVQTVRQWLNGGNILKVIFNVYLDEDKALYEQQLSR